MNSSTASDILLTIDKKRKIIHLKNASNHSIYIYIDEVKDKTIVEIRILDDGKKITHKQLNKIISSLINYLEEKDFPLITRHESHIDQDEEESSLRMLVMQEQFDILKPIVQNLSHKSQIFTVEKTREIPKALLIDRLTGSKIIEYIKNGKKQTQIPKVLKEVALSDSLDALPSLIQCFFLEDVSYNEIKNLALKFLHKNTAVDDKSYMQETETRYTHTIKLMICAMLAAKRFSRNSVSIFKIMIHALNHDDGHVALAHANEKEIHKVDERWWHLRESGRIIRTHLDRAQRNTVSKLVKKGFRKEDVMYIYTQEADSLVYSVQSHNKNESDQRGESFEAQMIKLFDKIISDFTDIFDLIYDENKLKFATELQVVNPNMRSGILFKNIYDFFNDELMDKAIKQLKLKGMIQSEEEENEIKYYISIIIRKFKQISRIDLELYNGPAEFISYIIESILEESDPVTGKIFYNLPVSLFKATEGIRAVKFSEHIYKLPEYLLERMSRAYIIEEMERRITRGEVPREAYMHVIDEEVKMQDWELFEWYKQLLIHQINNEVLNSEAKYSEESYSEYIKNWNLNNQDVKYGISLFEDGREIYSFDEIKESLIDRGHIIKSIDKKEELLIYLDVKENHIFEAEGHKCLIVVTKQNNPDGTVSIKREFVIKCDRYSDSRNSQNSFIRQNKFEKSFEDNTGLREAIKIAIEKGLIPQGVEIYLDESLQRLIFDDGIEDIERRHGTQYLTVESINKNFIERYNILKQEKVISSFEHEIMYPIDENGELILEVVEESTVKNDDSERLSIVCTKSTKKEQFVIREEKHIKHLRRILQNILGKVELSSTSKREHGARFRRKIKQNRTIQHSEADALYVICEIFNLPEFKNLFKKSQIYVALNSIPAFGEDMILNFENVIKNISKVKNIRFEYNYNTFKVPETFEELLPYFAMNIKKEDLKEIILRTVNNFMSKNKYTNRGLHTILVAIGQGYFQKTTGGTLTDVFQGIACGLGHDVGHILFGHGGESALKTFEQEKGKFLFGQNKIAITQMAIETPLIMLDKKIEDSTDDPTIVLHNVLKEISFKDRDRILEYYLRTNDLIKTKRKFYYFKPEAIEAIAAIYNQVCNMSQEDCNRIIEKYFIFSHAKQSAFLIQDKVKSVLSDGQTAKMCEVAALVHTSTDSLTPLEINECINGLIDKTIPECPLNMRKVLLITALADKFMTHSFDYWDMKRMGNISKGDKTLFESAVTDTISKGEPDDIQKLTDGFQKFLEELESSPIAKALSVADTFEFDIKDGKIGVKGDAEVQKINIFNSAMNAGIYTIIRSSRVIRPNWEIKKISRFLCEKVFEMFFGEINLEKMHPRQVRDNIFLNMNSIINTFTDKEGIFMIRKNNELEYINHKIYTSVTKEERRYWQDKKKNVEVDLRLIKRKVKIRENRGKLRANSSVKYGKKHL